MPLLAISVGFDMAVSIWKELGQLMIFGCQWAVWWSVVNGRDFFGWWLHAYGILRGFLL